MIKFIFKCFFPTLLIALMISCGNKGNNVSYAPEQTVSGDSVNQKQTPEIKLPETSNEPIDPVKAIYGIKTVKSEWGDDGVYLEDRSKYLTKRFYTYLGSAWDADELYRSQSGYYPSSQPVITQRENNPYIFDVEFKQYNSIEHLSVVVAIEDGEWKIDNMLIGEDEYRFNYTISIKEAYRQEGYPDENYEPSREEVVNSKKVPDFVPEINSMSERLLHSSK